MTPRDIAKRDEELTSALLDAETAEEERDAYAEFVDFHMSVFRLLEAEGDAFTRSVCRAVQHKEYE